jgi:hypothetical protein
MTQFYNIHFNIILASVGILYTNFHVVYDTCSYTLNVIILVSDQEIFIQYFGARDSSRACNLSMFYN